MRRSEHFFEERIYSRKSGAEMKCEKTTGGVPGGRIALNCLLEVCPKPRISAGGSALKVRVFLSWSGLPAGRLAAR